MQWEGSDYNPRRGPNDGEGGPPDKADNDANQNARADRSNIVEVELLADSVPRFKPLAEIATSMFPDEETAWKMAYIKQDPAKCKTMAELQQIQGDNRRENDVGNCMKLNAAEHPYFDGGLVPMLKAGRFNYMSTRNNNFSNRSQKGTIVVGTVAAGTPPFRANFKTSTLPNMAFASFNGATDDFAASRLGCFRDNHGSRDLPTAVLKSPRLDPAVCIQACQQKGQPYAGTQNGDSCFCGNQFGRHGALNASVWCQTECAGSEGFYKCGGWSANTIYNTTAVVGVAGGGCWIKNAFGCPRDKSRFLGTWWEPQYVADAVCRGRLCVTENAADRAW
jgi:hypothetical protein